MIVYLLYLGTWNILVTALIVCQGTTFVFSRYRLFPAPWDVESAYYSESPAEQWCIQSYKSQVEEKQKSPRIFCSLRQANNF